MRNLFIICCLALAAQAFTQTGEIIKITTETQENIINFYAENTATTAYNVELNINSTGFKHTRECPITETLNGGEKKLMTTLIAKKDEKAGYSISLKYSEARPTMGGTTTAMPVEATKADMSKGVFVFSKEGCGRCRHAEKFLKENNIAFTLFNITTSKEDASLLWRTLAESGYADSSVPTPVIVVDGKVHHDPSRLNGLLESLKK